jgi:hypothetical protein
MAGTNLEERVSAVEAEIAALKALAKTAAPENGSSWLDAWFGAFKDDPDFDAAMKRGEEYRRSQPEASSSACDDVPA